METYYSSDEALSERALQLVEFDVGSIRQAVAAERGDPPDVCLVAPNGYQTNGHPLRDSDSIRLIAYSKNSRVVYGTDGCNTCRHVLDKPLEAFTDDEREALSERTQLPPSLLHALARIIHN